MLGIRGHTDRLANARYRRRVAASDERTLFTALRPGLCPGRYHAQLARASACQTEIDAHIGHGTGAATKHAQSTDDSAEASADVTSSVSPQLLGAQSRTVRCTMRMCGAQYTRHARNMLTTETAQSCILTMCAHPWKPPPWSERSRDCRVRLSWWRLYRMGPQTPSSTSYPGSNELKFHQHNNQLATSASIPCTRSENRTPHTLCCTHVQYSTRHHMN